MTPSSPSGVAVIVGVAWFVMIWTAGTVLRPRPTRSLPSPDATELPDRVAMVERVGATILRRFRRRVQPLRSRQIGSTVLIALPLGVIDLRLGLIAALGSVVLPLAKARRSVDENHAQVVQELPEVIDLLTVAVAGGLTVPLAVRAVARRVPGVVAEAFDRCGEQAALGRRLADELEVIPDTLGDATRPLVRALVAAERYGTPIVDALARVSADVRVERRRRAEIEARRLPIKLLFPLVACVLPAFVLLTVVPVLAGSLDAIRG